MQYKVYFVNRAFKDVLNRDVLLNIINREKDEYQKKQIKLLLNEIKFATILADAKMYFKDWDNVIYVENEIIIVNRITNQISRLVVHNENIYVAVNSEEDVLITFLNAKYRPFILEQTNVEVGTIII